MLELDAVSAALVALAEVGLALAWPRLHDDALTAAGRDAFATRPRGALDFRLPARDQAAVLTQFPRPPAQLNTAKTQLPTSVGALLPLSVFGMATRLATGLAKSRTGCNVRLVA